MLTIATTVLISMTCSVGLVATAGAAAAAPYCDPGYVYSVYRNDPNSMTVFDRYAVVNGTGSTISGSFRADTGGSVAATAGITLSVEAGNAVLGKVAASVNGAVTKTMTASTGVTATSGVKPYSTLKGDYGIYREKVTMKRYYLYSNCSAGSVTYFAYSAPYRKAWKLYY